MAFTPVNLWSTTNKFDVEKAIAAICYVAKAIPNIGIHKLLKLIYFADKSHIAKYGRFMFDETYSALKYGTVPSNCYNIIKTAKGSESRFPEYKTEIEAIIVRGKTVADCPAPDMDNLSESDIECLNEAIQKYGRMSFNALHDRSVGTAYRKAASNNRMSDIDIAIEAGANEEMMKYIALSKENARMCL